ncbi:hypothetical protein ET464_10095 [Paenibacillus protaetiae]|uniref:Uncharacterized protein n=1 Tax=Paenibacillus protaetiae TaxID=2509456 RepID=A0A4P6EVM7_9BACL|nr:hypothetical protein ET464_10095 [Paenibacillus protaetiae]
MKSGPSGFLFVISFFIFGISAPQSAEIFTDFPFVLLFCQKRNPVPNGSNHPETGKELQQKSALPPFPPPFPYFHWITALLELMSLPNDKTAQKVS